ncbi:Cof-type HAD-IIB family hydrolase [Streptococcus sp. A22]|uniref:Cof-type HAD-IIB family hydrolase n=1 Tax=Streptococcus TaxID=1301 RepID=UPI00211D69F8|nr:Cof-type HAD-IIB family hydrolase [Streptococcus suis]UUM56933.1 Cof-type HAD-IIB family hydrolase [Streptococcus suis]
MIKLIATDMDGTFLDGNGQIDRARFSAILDQLDARDIPFVIASGNGMDRLLKLCQGFEDRLIFVSDNGARVVEKGETRVRHMLDRDLVAAILDYFRGSWGEVCLMLANDQTIFMQEGANQPFAGSDLPIAPEQMQAFLDKVTFLADLSQLPAEQPIYKAGIWVEEGKVEVLTSAFNRALEGRLTAVTSGYGSIDILPVGIHKAWGIEQVIQPLGITMAQVMAFGDSDNDLEMLAQAGYSYAMENATDRVKAVAKYRAPSHLDSGVLQVIEEFLQTH